ncbi:MAG: hypothetical protein JXQ90_02980 [Cyclobacteriaceae bacterium]
MNLKSIIVWSLMILAVMAFWVSLRSDDGNFEYTLIALGLWAVSFAVNKWWKNEKES